MFLYLKNESKGNFSYIFNIMLFNISCKETDIETKKESSFFFFF